MTKDMSSGCNRGSLEDRTAAGVILGTAKYMSPGTGGWPFASGCRPADVFLVGCGALRNPLRHLALSLSDSA